MPEKMLTIQKPSDDHGNMVVIFTGFGKLRRLQRYASREEEKKRHDTGSTPATNRSGQQSHS